MANGRKRSAFTVIVFGHSTCVPCKQLARDLKAAKIRFKYYDVKTTKGFAKGVECGIGPSVPWVVILKSEKEVYKECGYAKTSVDEIKDVIAPK